MNAPAYEPDPTPEEVEAWCIRDESRLVLKALAAGLVELGGPVAREAKRLAITFIARHQAQHLRAPNLSEIAAACGRTDCPNPTAYAFRLVERLEGKGILERHLWDSGRGVALYLFPINDTTQQFVDLLPESEEFLADLCL